MWDRQYECNLVPPLDRWFNLKSELYEPHIERKEDQCVQWTVDQSQASEESSEQAGPRSPSPDPHGLNLARQPHPKRLAAKGGKGTKGALAGKTQPPDDWSNYLRERYWAGGRPMITCGREVASRSNWELALHLRLGDLIAPVIGPGDSVAQGKREAQYSERAAQAARGLARAFSILSQVQMTMRNASQATKFRTLVVSDSPFSVVKDFLSEEAGVQMKVERTFHDDVATFTDVLARFSDGALRLSFMNEDANPLVWPCTASLRPTLWWCLPKTARSPRASRSWRRRSAGGASFPR